MRAYDLNARKLLPGRIADKTRGAEAAVHEQHCGAVTFLLDGLKNPPEKPSP